jgi:hypothetical protein
LIGNFLASRTVTEDVCPSHRTLARVVFVSR